MQVVVGEREVHPQGLSVSSCKQQCPDCRARLASSPPLPSSLGSAVFRRGPVHLRRGRGQQQAAPAHTQRERGAAAAEFVQGWQQVQRLLPTAAASVTRMGHALGSNHTQEGECARNARSDQPPPSHSNWAVTHTQSVPTAAAAALHQNRRPAAPLLGGGWRGGWALLSVGLIRAALLPLRGNERRGQMAWKCRPKGTGSRGGKRGRAQQKPRLGGKARALSGGGNSSGPR